jgi:hypothetical protein
VQRDRQQAGEADEICVNREDRQPATLGRRADEEICVRALKAPGAARVEMLRRSFEIFDGQHFVFERPQVIAQAFERRPITDAAEQFLPDRADDGDPLTW